MKYGRRKWVRALRARHRANREEAARLHTDEHRVAIEIGLLSFARYRECERWQQLGEVGRWFAQWRAMWRRLAIASSQWTPPTTSTLDYIYRRAYYRRDSVEMRMRSWANAITSQPYSVRMDWSEE